MGKADRITQLEGMLAELKKRPLQREIKSCRCCGAMVSSITKIDPADVIVRVIDSSEKDYIESTILRLEDALRREIETL